ncbi:MAG: hypothetical protein HDT30_13635 [Clostridiales bacterium]|nr:hypothetical protein [Clostridiales bacterium]
MKKKLGMLLFSIILVAGLVSCSSKDIAEGTWELIKGYSGEVEVTADQLQEQGIGGTTFTFKNGTVTIKMTASSEESEGTYTVEGNNITISSANEEGTIKGTIADEELTITDENTSLKLVFKRK